jgi:hypothetical protein
MMYP